jgi:branched-chain amino acid transport system ATP-binding protein
MPDGSALRLPLRDYGAIGVTGLSPTRPPGIAHCPEGRRVFPHLSVRESLAMGALLRRDRAGIAHDLEAM